MLKRFLAVLIAACILLLNTCVLAESWEDPDLDRNSYYVQMVESFNSSDYDGAIYFFTNEKAPLAGYSPTGRPIANFYYYLAKAFSLFLEQESNSQTIESDIDCDEILSLLESAKAAGKDIDTVTFELNREDVSNVTYSISAIMTYIEGRDLQQKGNKSGNEGKTEDAMELYTQAAEKYSQSQLFDSITRKAELDKWIGEHKKTVADRFSDIQTEGGIKLTFADSEKDADTVYSLVCRPVSGGRETVLEGNGCEFDISGLIPSTEYEIRVKAGEDSFKVNATTPPAEGLSGDIVSRSGILLRKVSFADLEEYGAEKANRRGKFSWCEADEELGAFVLVLRKNYPTGYDRYYMVSSLKNAGARQGEYTWTLVLRLKEGGVYSASQTASYSEMGTSSYSQLYFPTDALFEEFYQNADAGAKNAIELTGSIELYLSGMYAGELPVVIIRK